MSADIIPAQIITNTVSTGIPDGGTKVGGGQTNALQIWVIEGIDCVATGTTIIVPAQAGVFVPVNLFLELTNISGNSGEPTVSIGTNSATFNNLVTATPLTGLTNANQLFALSLAAGAKAIDITSLDVKLNVSVAAVDYDPYTINCYITGYIR